jgi:ATP-binding protein involved in chromosome partitioning
MTPEKVLAALSNVQEPDLGKDIVTLNMVKDIEIEGNYVAFTIVLTTPACPMKDHIKNACINAVKLLVNKDATVNVRFDSQTTTHRKDAPVWD